MDAAQDALKGCAQGVLSRLGWTVHSRKPAGFAVRREGAKADFCSFVLESGDDAASGTGGHITPALHLRMSLSRRAKLRPAEREGLDELLSALFRLLESRRRPHGAGRPSPGESHEGKEGVDLLLRTTFACNQRCPFCFVPLSRRRLDLALIAAELDALARRPGPKRGLMLSGGEPTVEPRLTEIIAAAKRKGFRRFVLQTNGVLLTPELRTRLVRLGVRSYMVSFHSHRPALYDEITGSRGLFGRAAEGLTGLLRDPACHVTVNVVVNSANYRDLPGLMGFIGGLAGGLPRRRRPGVYFSMINEYGHEKAPDWTVDLAKVAPFLRRAEERCRQDGLRVESLGSETAFPACLFADPGRHASRRDFPQDRVRYAEDFTGESEAIGRAKRPACRACAFDPKCLGVPARYALMFGLGALQVPGRRPHD